MDDVLRQYDNCIKTKEWNPLEGYSVEHKFYCSDVKNVALKIDLEDGERVELKSFEEIGKPFENGLVVEEKESDESVMGGGATEARPITQEEAVAIARSLISGELKKVEVETKYGKRVFAIKIEEQSGVVKEALIEIATGKVISVEVQ